MAASYVQTECMRPHTIVIGGAAAVALLIGVTVVSAQSGDLILLDEIEVDPVVEVADVGSDAGSDAATDDAATVDSGPRIVIEGISDYEPPEIIPRPKPKNPRALYEQLVTRHATDCIVRHGVDELNVEVGLLYLVRAGRPQATLSAVTNDEGLYVPRFLVDVMRSVGETRPIDVDDRRRFFKECLQVVPLGSFPVVSERVGFRIKHTAMGLRALDVKWQRL